MSFERGGSEMNVRFLTSLAGLLNSSDNLLYKRSNLMDPKETMSGDGARSHVDDLFSGPTACHDVRGPHIITRHLQ